MNITKFEDWFNPSNYKTTVHIIGCGSVGSTAAELLVRMGLTNFSLYDFDTVEAHNLANQMFTQRDIGLSKVDALERLLIDINPLLKRTIKKYPNGYEKGMKIGGHIFLCIDNIDVRRAIMEEHKMNQNIIAVFDFRTRLTDAQHYATIWSDYEGVKNFLKTMDFSHEEAKENTPVTACRLELGVAPTVRLICTLGVNNYINYLMGKPLKKFITSETFDFDVDAY